MKKPTVPAILITSQATLSAAVHEIVTARLQHSQLTTQMDQEITAIQRKYHDRLNTLGREIESREAGVQLYCQQHRAEAFAEKKSIDLTIATVGFRETPYRVEKIRTKDTWEEIAARMAAITATDAAGNPILKGKDYVTYPQPTLAKSALLRDRPNLPPDLLRTIGIRFTCDELFYITPRSQVAAASEAA